MSTTVDSTPTEQGPPSTMAGILPAMSSSTSRALVGEGLPEVLAEGAARGTPAASMMARATGWEGIRMPTVSSPAEVRPGTAADFFTTIVSGPGQKCSANR